MLKKITILSALLLLTSNISAKTKIKFWQFWTDPSIRPTIEKIVNDFETANPDIEVELTDLTWANGHEKIVLAFSSGVGPDVVELGSDWIAQFAVANQLEAIGDQIAQDSSDFQGWSMAQYGSQTYAHPWFLGTRLLFGNRDLLTRAGYDNEFVPFNMDDLMTSAKKIDSLGRNIHGWGSNAPEKHRLYKKFMPFFWTVGAKIFTPDKKYSVVSSEQAVQALNYYKELHDSCGFVGNQRAIEDAFLDGKIGFIISGDWLLKRIKNENRNINLISTSIPGLKFPGKSFMGGEFLAINKNSKNKEAALKLIRFITSPANQVLFCKKNFSANPSSKIAQKDEHFTSDIHLQSFIRQLNASVHPPVDPDWVEMEGIIEEAIEDALFGAGLPATALREAQIKITELKKGK